MRSAIVLTIVLAGCSSSPANVAGTYTTNLTNDTNGCMSPNYTVGQMTAGVPIVITQSGNAVTGTVQGATATYLDLVLGSHIFDGDVSGTHIDMILHGSHTYTSGACVYTVDADCTADLSGDVISGTITYRAITNHDASCGFLETCTTLQRFNGARPPSM